jgi:carbonic anhydrase
MLAGALALGGAFLFLTPAGQSVQFLLGGAMVNLGYRLQDHLASYDFAPQHEHEISPEEVWKEMLRQNELAAGVRRTFPRSARHPLVAMVVCMDARLDTVELTGDTRKYYYLVRTAGSVLEAKEAEMLELAVENGVKLIVLTTHTDCAAERAAASAELRRRFPALTEAVDARQVRIAELLQRPAIADRVAQGQLAVKRMTIDTATELLRPQ